jgi:hypothetical protein
MLATAPMEPARHLALNTPSASWAALLNDLRDGRRVAGREVANVIDAGIRAIESELERIAGQRRSAPHAQRIVVKIWEKREALLRRRERDLRALLPITLDEPEEPRSFADLLADRVRQRIHRAVATLARLKSADIPEDMKGLVPQALLSPARRGN